LKEYQQFRITQFENESVFFSKEAIGQVIEETEKYNEVVV
jgi:hypothetical protein